MRKITSYILKNHNIAVMVVLIRPIAAGIHTLIKHPNLEPGLDKFIPKRHPAFVYSANATELFDIRDANVELNNLPNGSWQKDFKNAFFKSINYLSK